MSWASCTAAGGATTPELVAQQPRDSRERRARLVGHRVAPGALAETAQERAEVLLPARRGRLHPAERPRPGQQAALRGGAVGPEELVGQRGAAPEVLHDEQPGGRVVGDEHRAGPQLGRHRGEQLGARHLERERVGPTGRRLVAVVLHDEGARQRERIARDPGPGHHRAVAAAEVLRVREHDRGPRTPAQKPLGRRERTEHRPGEAAQVVHHRARGYPGRGLLRPVLRRWMIALLGGRLDGGFRRRRPLPCAARP